MKKIGIIGLYVHLFLLIGCSKEFQTREMPSGKAQIKVLSTTRMIGDLVSFIGEDRINNTTLILGEIDPHSYELVKGDGEKIEQAVLVFYNGLNLEHGASLQYKIRHHSESVALGDYILKENPQDILLEQGQLDPHIWMDISLWSKVIDPIVAALSKVDPEGKEIYTNRGAELKRKMLEEHDRVRTVLQEVPEDKRYLVTSHDAFAYFTRSYLSTKTELLNGTWRERFAAPEGLSPDGQLGAIDLQKIISYLIKHHVRVVFPESNVSRDSLYKILLACREKGTRVRFSTKTLYGDCMGPKGSEEGTYLGMIGHNAEVLVEEWGKQ